MTRESDSNEPAADAAKAVGRGLLWVVIAVAIVVVVLGVFLIGPLGLIIVLPALLPGTIQRRRWLPGSERTNPLLNQSSPICGCSCARVPGPSPNPRPPATSVVTVREASVPITLTAPEELARKKTRPSGATATAVGQ